MQGFRLFTLFLSWLIVFNASPSWANDNRAVNECEQSLHWIYKELTLNNLDISYQRTFNKFLLSLHYLEAKGNKKQLQNPHFEKIFKTLKAIDPKFREFDLSKRSFLSRLFGKKVETLDTVSLKSVMLDWKKLQSSQPNMFLGMDKEHFLDDWDIQTIELVDHIADFPVTSPITKSSLMLLRNKINATKEDFLSKRHLDINNVEKSYLNSKQQLFQNLKENYSTLVDELKTVCSKDEIEKYFLRDNYVCPIPNSNADLLNISSQLKEIQDIFFTQKPFTIYDPVDPRDIIVTPPVEEEVYVPVEKLAYERSEHPKSTYCKRNPEMITTIVIHHTGSSNTATPLEINGWHLDRETNGEPWYMVGYNYLISDSFQGASPENLKVFEGREPEIRGAHAGGYTPPISQAEKDFYAKYKIQCGNDQIGFEERSALSQLDNAGGISGNLISYGIAVIGNFSPEKFNYYGNELYIPENIFAPKDYLPSEQTIELLGKFSCSLQKKNPNIQTIVPHNYFKGTECPGTLILYLNRIAQKANDYGCIFNVVHSRHQEHK